MRVPIPYHFKYSPPASSGPRPYTAPTLAIPAHTALILDVMSAGTDPTVNNLPDVPVTYQHSFTFPPTYPCATWQGLEYGYKHVGVRISPGAGITSGVD